MIAYKITTHDLRSPIQGGEPITEFAPGSRLPEVDCDTTARECGAGWNACERPEAAARIAGLWPNGRPARLWRLSAPDEIVVSREDKLRAPWWDVLDEEPIEAAIVPLSEAFGRHADAMIAEQIAWHRALGRPGRDVAAVEAGLHAALDARGLGWRLRKYNTAWAARDAWDAWDAWGAWAARDAWDAWNAWDAWGAWAARGARDAWAARDAWVAWAARGAQGALMVHYAALQGWIDHDPALLTTGTRDAYAAGLRVAVPVDSGVLGWAMDNKEHRDG